MKFPESLRTEFELEFNTVHEAKIVFNSIMPEIKTAPSERSSVNMELNKNILKMQIDAEDASSLRASLNSYLRWIILSEDVLNLKK